MIIQYPATQPSASLNITLVFKSHGITKISHLNI